VRVSFILTVLFYTCFVFGIFAKECYKNWLTDVLCVSLCVRVEPLFMKIGGSNFYTKVCLHIPVLVRIGQERTRI
jgi:hypothetical protein